MIQTAPMTSALDPRRIDHALAWLASGELQPQPEALDEQLIDRAKRVAICFDQFPDVLQLILELSVFRPPVDHRLQGDAYNRYAERRQGADQLAASLLYYVQIAKQGETHERSPQPVRRPEPDSGSGPDSFSSPDVALR